MNSNHHVFTPRRALHGAAGFTLIELMITVAIVAILGAIALPAYQNAVLKGRRAEGRAALVDFLQQQERYFTQYNTYLEVAVGDTASTVPFKTYSGESKTTSAYWLGATTCPGTPTPSIRTCVLVSAERQPNPSADPDVKNLTILSSGKRSCTGTNTAACWP